MFYGPVYFFVPFRGFCYDLCMKFNCLLKNSSQGIYLYLYNLQFNVCRLRSAPVTRNTSTLPPWYSSQSLSSYFTPSIHSSSNPIRLHVPTSSSPVRNKHSTFFLLLYCRAWATSNHMPGMPSRYPFNYGGSFFFLHALFPTLSARSGSAGN